ncbi:hypothetical protein ACFQX8_12105 [Klenkia terrae]|uniref:hypothetical protein n=1 Tax=Klenkia terrae TaxID=1052259 RepID=UPI00360A0652
MTARWRLTRAGIQNVWHYLDTEFVLTGGRMVLRGTNGSGKSRALELLLPFLLDADRRRMDSSGSAAVNLDRLMRVGDPGTTNRVGYLWLELAHGDGLTEPDGHLTLGAHLRWSANTGTVAVSWFVTELRVGHGLRLIDADRHPLRREDLNQLLGPNVLTSSADTHRERVRERVFGLVDAQAAERFDGLTQLLHTLRSPTSATGSTRAGCLHCCPTRCRRCPRPRWTPPAPSSTRSPRPAPCRTGSNAASPTSRRSWPRTAATPRASSVRRPGRHGPPSGSSAGPRSTTLLLAPP